MNKLFVLAVFVAVPKLGLASVSGQFHLLEDSSLTFLGQTLPAQTHSLLQEEAPPPPPEAPIVPAAPAGEVPSLGAVIGMMAAGGGVLLLGVVLTLYGLIWGVLGYLAATDCSAAGSDCSVFLGVGVVLLVIGIACDVAGTVLLIVGNHKRRLRNEMLAARNVSVNYNPVAKAPMLTYAFHF
jgi:hypothetical protein